MLFGIGGVVWLGCLAEGRARRARESMSIESMMPGKSWNGSQSRWHCARHVPSEEKTSVAVGRGVAEPSHRESGLGPFTMRPIPLLFSRPDIRTELIDTACPSSKGCVSTVEKATTFPDSFLCFPPPPGDSSPGLWHPSAATSF